MPRSWSACTVTSRAVDTQDWDLYRTCFTADAVVDYSGPGGPCGGVDEVVTWLQGVMGWASVSQHYVTNARITVNGDTGTIDALFFGVVGKPESDGGPGLVKVGGGYSDRMRRTPDGWRIEHLLDQSSWHEGPMPDLA